MKKIALLQPNYIPWKGVFDMISRVDIFVFYDDVQYTHRDWRNRNKIKTSNGEIWLTVPVKEVYGQKICETEIDTSQKWQIKHYKSITQSYSKTKFFKNYEALLNKIYMQNWNNLNELNIFCTKEISASLGLFPQWVKSSDLQIEGDKNGEKIIKICKHLKANHVINGPSSQNFLDENLFKKNDIILEYMEYFYPEYTQAYPPFSHNVSILDLLFHCGPNSKEYIKSIKI